MSIIFACINIESIIVTMTTAPNKSNTIVRQVLKQIINDPPSSRRSEFDHLKLNQAVSYLQRKIDRQQAQVKVLSQQLGREIEAKQQLLQLLNEEKEKNNKLTYHLNHSNRNAAETKKKLAKIEVQQDREAKIKEEYELKLAKCKDMLRKKEEILAKNNFRIEEYEKSIAHIPSIETQLRDLRVKMLEMKKRQQDLLSENEILKKQLKQQCEQIQAKDQALLFSQEHLRRLRQEYQEIEDNQEQSRQLQLQMKELLEQQNQQIKLLQNKLSKQPSLASSLCNSEDKEWDMDLFKKEIIRSIDSHMRDGSHKKALQQEVLMIMDALKNSFSIALRQVAGDFD